MKRPAGILALGLAVICAPACGRKGPLQRPVSPRPQAVEKLVARQRGASVVFEWTNPARAIDGRPLRALRAAEVWVLDLGPAGAKGPLKPRDFETRARLVRRVPARELRSASGRVSGTAADAIVVYPVSGDGFHPGTQAFSVRVLDDKGRPSEFSAPVPVDLKACPRPPEIQGVEVFEGRIEVRWSPPEANIDGSAPAGVAGYAVFRSADGGAPERLTLSPVAGPVFADRQFAFGASYAYTVRAAAAGADPGLESDDSAPVRVVPKDTFPPAPPSGIVVLAGPDVISLSWAPGREDDLAGYRVWRKEAGGSGFVSLTPGSPLPGNAFTDTTAEKGKTYVYAVSASDRAGNESSRTESAPVVLKGKDG